jgi:hypothetical protein
VAIGQPVWSRVDEAAHYDVIAQYAAGIYPHDSVTTIRPETLEVMKQTDVYGFVVDNAYQRPDVAGFQAMPSGLTDAQHVLWIRRHGWQYSYEAFQPPLYYALATPFWKVGDALGGAFGALYAVRIFDALLAALLAPLAMLIALRIWPAATGAEWAAAVLTAALPGVDANLTSVTNDVLVSVLGAAVLLVTVSGQVTLRRAALIGALLGGALLSKTTAVALVPAVILSLALRRRGGGLVPVAAALAVAALVVTPWIYSNLAIYGEVITSTEQLAMSAFPARTGALDFWSVSTLHAFVTFWSGDPFLSLTTAVPMALMAAIVCALAFAGLLRARRTAEVSLHTLAVVGVAAAGAALVSVTSPVLAAFNAPGRLAYVGVCAATALVAVGLWLELPSLRLRRASIGIVAALALIGIAGLLYPQAPAQRDPGNPVIAQSRPLDDEGSFQNVTIVMETCDVDPAGNVWLGVVIQNSDNAPAEWSQSAVIRSGGETLATSGYSHSTPFPMTLPPGQQISGWLWFGPRTRLGGARSVTVSFRNVATNNYESIGDINIPITVC